MEGADDERLLRGCLVGTLAQERSSDAPTSSKCERYFTAWTALLTEHLAEVAAAHPPRIAVEPSDLATLLVAAIEGCLLRSKGSRSGAALVAS